jgi:hypothetical protein
VKEPVLELLEPGPQHDSSFPASPHCPNGTQLEGDSQPGNQKQERLAWLETHGPSPFLKAPRGWEKSLRQTAMVRHTRTGLH